MATQICPYLTCKDAKKQMVWLQNVAQFREEFCLHNDAGKIQHAELSLNKQVVIMLADIPGSSKSFSEGNATGGVYITMESEEALRAHFEYAKAKDPASISKEPFYRDHDSLDYFLKHDDIQLFFGTYVPKLKP